ncbi:hypothetical protein PG997_007297 [Apiospora hydei]|uniref:Rhodopsin domain-containing protein n=1 Tax=Apiospora hydei TaxID=1337664 RepID=A0ABR1W7M7_9PEZI
MEEHGMMPLPQGEAQDFHGTTHLQIMIIIVASVTFAFATVLLMLRIYTSARIVKKPAVSDCEYRFIRFIAFGTRFWNSISKIASPAVLITFSWGLSGSYFIGMVLSMPHGLGRHLWNVTAGQIAGYYRYLLLFALAYIWSPTLAKLAILVLYRQINPFKTFRICVYITAAAITIYTIIFTALFAGPCNPGSLSNLTCLDNIAFTQAILNMFIDVVLIVIPIPMIYGLHMPLRQKIIIWFILALGSAAVVASIVRIAYIRNMMVNPDATWTQAYAALWSSIEMNFAIACNCMARLRPFVRAHMPTVARFLDYSGDATPDFATVRSLRGSGRNEPGYDGVRRGEEEEEEATENIQLHGFRGRSKGETQSDSGYILVRDEVAVDVEHVEVGSRRSSSEILIRR